VTWPVSDDNSRFDRAAMAIIRALHDSDCDPHESLAVLAAAVAGVLAAQSDGPKHLVELAEAFGRQLVRQARRLTQ
jgi:hypothetical protein